jgi:aryl-alcohol dehydrogenase-like predicted oxidoreductase
MRTRRLGRTDLRLATIGLGTWAIGGGGWDFAWGPQDDGESIAAIRRALDLGINWIDTAPVYGLGHSEEVVGRAIEGRRNEVVIATKCGRVWDRGDTGAHARIKADSIRREVEASLRRLQVEVIDLYQIHWPEPEQDIEEAWAAIADLVNQGKVRYGGVSNFSVAQLKRIQPIHPVASVQPPYNMLRRGIEDELLPYCAQNGIGVVVYSPLAAGLLTGKFDRQRAADLPEDDWRRNSVDHQEPRLTANLALVEKLQRIAGRQGRSPSQLAIAWALRRPEVTAAIVGARRPEQIEETVKAADWTLSPAEIAEIEEALLERGRDLG